ncbi:MAG: S-layer family protein, partial [Candidatus Sungbacteria bacterium]|nr:S-layer family protein [Candidatus Sungbacteria bacterium]
MIIRDGTIYFALKEIAPQSPYSADYLRIRILQKKLQGTKVGREWYTSREWLDEYLARYAIKQFQPEAPKSEAILEPGLPEAHTIETASAPGVASPQAAEVESAAPVMANESIAVEGSAAGNSFEFKGLKLEKFKDGNLELKEEILRRHDFRELVGRLRMPVPKLFFAAPLIAALAFAALWPAGAKLFPWRAAAAEKISAVAHDAGAFLLSVEPPELQDFEKLFGAISDWPDAFEKRFAGMDRKRPVQESGEDNFGVGVAFRSAIAAAFQQVGDFALEARIPSPAEFSAGVAALIDVPSRITGSVTSISSIGDALRDFLSSLPRPRLPERLALLFNLTSPPLTAPQANAPVRLALEPKGQGSGSEQESPAPPEESVTPQQVALGAPLPQTPVRQVIETIETREVVRPADVSAFQAKLDELNAGLRTQVSKLITDVASLYDISDRKVTITRAFAPSQSINELQELKVDSGLTVRSGDITLSTGSLTLSGSSATLTTGGGLTVSGSAAISGTLGVSGTGTSTIGYGFTGATSGGSIGFGTSSPSQFFSVSGNTYLTGGLGLGTVTTSPGGLQTTGMAVIGSTLDVLGTGTSTFSGPLVIAGALSVNAGVVTISSTSTVTTQFAITRGAVSPHTFSSWATGVANSAVTDATLLVNSASAVADSNLLGIAIAGSPRFIVDAEGDIYGRNLILEGATTQASTTVSGAITIEGNATIGDAANADTHIIRGATNLYASTTQAALDIWNSSNGDILSLRSGTGQTPTTSFTFSSGGNFGIGSTTPTVGLSVATSTYITAGLGVGEATTSSGGLLVKGLGVFAQTLDIRGTGTSTYAGGITA